MTWILDEQRRMLRDSAQSFLSERAPVAHLRKLRDANDAAGYSCAAVARLRRAGLQRRRWCPRRTAASGSAWPRPALIAEQIGHTLAPTPFFSTAVLAAWLLKTAGSPAQQKAWLPRIAAADVVMALAVDEQSRHRPTSLDTTAARDGGGWRIDGQKLLVVDGHVADALIVAARADRRPALLLVSKSTPGLESRAHGDGRRAQRRACPLRRRAGGQRCTDRHRSRPAPRLLESTLDVGRVVAAAELLGLADEVFERTVDYLKERKQFDRVIGEFQALQHRCAELFCDLELTRAIVRQALKALDDAAPMRRCAWRRPRRAPASPPTARCRRACRCTAASA